MSNVNLTWILFVSLVYSCGLIHSDSADLSVEGKLGDDVTLQCNATKDFTVLKWKKPDLKSKYLVYFIRRKKVDKDYQHESFKDRVELKDSNMKNGDASVILKNITISDTGTYECYVGEGGSSELINRVTLTVISGADKWKHLGLVMGVSVLVAVVGGGGGFIIYRKYKRPKEQNHQPAADEASDHELQDLTPKPNETMEEVEKTPLKT